jgi:GntR family transcriptional regulator
MLGEYSAGTKLPSETKLCAMYDVSRITVRQALDGLAHDGLINRIQGKGTIIKSIERKPFEIDYIKGFKKNIADDSTTVRSDVLSIDTITGDSILLKSFDLPSLDKNSEFMRIRRLRYVNEAPCAIQTSFVRKEIGEKMLEFDLTTASLYELIESIVGLKITFNAGICIPIAATPELCTLLKVKPGSAHFYFQGISYAEGDIPVELYTGYYHGDKFELHVTVPHVHLVEK